MSNILPKDSARLETTHSEQVKNKLTPLLDKLICDVASVNPNFQCAAFFIGEKPLNLRDSLINALTGTEESLEHGSVSAEGNNSSARLDWTILPDSAYEIGVRVNLPKHESSQSYAFEFRLAKNAANVFVQRKILYIGEFFLVFDENNNLVDMQISQDNTYELTARNIKWGIQIFNGDAAGALAVTSFQDGHSASDRKIEKLFMYDQDSLYFSGKPNPLEDDRRLADGLFREQRVYAHLYDPIKAVLVQHPARLLQRETLLRRRLVNFVDEGGGYKTLDFEDVLTELVAIQEVAKEAITGKLGEVNDSIRLAAESMRSFPSLIVSCLKSIDAIIVNARPEVVESLSTKDTK